MSIPESGSMERQPVHETAEHSQPRSFTEGPDQGITHLVAENGGIMQGDTYLPPKAQGSYQTHMNLVPNRAADVEGQTNLSPAQSHEEITHLHSDVTVNNTEEPMYPVIRLRRDNFLYC